MTNIGELGEKLVGRWLETKDWSILHYRWHCRQGEIDIIAQKNSENVLAFVEVKTRGKGNWDANGLLAITRQKQVKVLYTAKVFLAKYPYLSFYNCRFDVALVNYKLNNLIISEEEINAYIKIGNPIILEGYELTIIDYIESAFD